MSASEYADWIDYSCIVIGLSSSSQQLIATMHPAVHTLGMDRISSVAVFSGSSAGNDSRYAEAAAELGCLIGERKLDFIYGGGCLGLMGIAARNAGEHGSRVIGVLPEIMDTDEVKKERYETELIIVPDMHSRKARMYSLADAYIALPGGIGTLEELAEIYTWKQIGYHQKEIALLNTAGYWDPLIAMLDKAVAEGFLSEAVRRMLIIADSPESLMESLEISPA